MVLHALWYFALFGILLLGADIAIRSVEKISRSLRISSFAVSFLILGAFTSVAEFSVGINAVIENDPEIYVGNLIGASIVLFMLLIPLLAIIGHKLEITKEFQGSNLVHSLFVIAAPVLLTLNGHVGRLDGIIALTTYVLLAFSIQTKRGFVATLFDPIQKRSPIRRELLRIVIGVIMIFIASHYIVVETHYFAELFSISPFIISLIIISLGTNIPELSFVLRSLFKKNNQVALGDYIGSAAFNTFLFGVLTLVNNQPVFLIKTYHASLLFLVISLILFYFFAKSRQSISRVEGIVLLVLYVLFLSSEIFLTS